MFKLVVLKLCRGWGFWLGLKWRRQVGGVVGAADRGVGFVGEEGIGCAVVPGQGNAEECWEGCGVGAAWMWG